MDGVGVVMDVRILGKRRWHLSSVDDEVIKAGKEVFAGYMIELFSRYGYKGIPLRMVADEKNGKFSIYSGDRIVGEILPHCKDDEVFCYI